MTPQPATHQVPGHPDVAFGSLVAAELIARESRFHARIRVADAPTGTGEALVHVANSGRIAEALRPGGPLAVRRARDPQRRTGYDLVAARVTPDAAQPLPPGPGAEAAAAFDAWWERATGSPLEGTAAWASLDTRLPPSIVAAAAARGDLAGYEGARLLAREPRLGNGRADLLLDVEGREVIVEVKSTTLVIAADASPAPRRAAAAAPPGRDPVTPAGEAQGRFPDAPSTRARRHAEHLAGLGGERLIVVVIGRADATAAAAHAEVDPAFAAALAEAHAAGVDVRAGVCAVGPAGVRWLHEVPFRFEGAPSQPFAAPPAQL